MSGDGFPILSVEDLESVVAFYGRLGYVTTYAFPPEGTPGFVTLERDGSTLGIARRSGAEAHRFSYWVYVDDVDAAFSALVADGAPVVAEPRTEPWGERVASVRDPDGNIVHLGAPTEATN
ncbi:MAG TPA: VOC family protein [Acidimicrobiales bacterium]|nr:VOC family protein [Acidimicrobiales bacterium]